MKGTPSYIKSLVKVQPEKPASRKVWSIDLQTVWLPFFTATNAMHETAIPVDAIGHPLRLAYAKDGSVRFGNNGKPVIRVAKELQASVKLIRENFTASLQAYANDVFTDHETEYKAVVKASIEAGKPIAEHDAEMLLEAMQAIEAEVKGDGAGQGAGAETVEQAELVTA